MNYALISNKNNRHSRNNKTPPNSGYYILKAGSYYGNKGTFTN